MLERDIERYLVAKVRDRGGRCFKFVSPGNVGVADRIVILPGGVLAFVELKQLGLPLEPLQEKFARDVKALGQLCYHIDSKQEVDALLKELTRV